MVWNVDKAVGEIVDALKAKGMYDDTLIIMTADNGGPIYMSGDGGGNNYPLKGDSIPLAKCVTGGKAGNWEGGIRVNGFVSGGFVPAKMRGKKLQGLVAAWDWYATIIQGIAGADPTDSQAAAVGLPAIDSVDQWPYLSGAQSEPARTSLALGTTSDPTDIWASRNDIVVHGMIAADRTNSSRLWKLLVGQEPQAIWTG